jgi:hypothetical protein
MKKILPLLLLPFCALSAAPEVKQEVVQLLTPKLNSDRISHFFGSYGVETISMAESPFGEGRIANLYSLQGDEKILRTLAVVDFQQPVHESLKPVHKEICEGQSIGIALRKNGWMIDKLPVYFGSVSLSPQLRAWMQESGSDKAAVHIYKLHVFKENSEERLHYCTIIEVHSPQYLDENWLQSLYPDQYPQFRKTSDEVSPLMTSLNALISAFPGK